jgi:peptidyl-prolyl cis-trans isomerase B (cyclophilin B)
MSRKNPFKGAIILTITALIIGALWFVLSKKMKGAEQSEQNASLLFPDWKREDFLGLLITGPSGVIKLNRLAEGQDQWIVNSGEKSFAADSGSVNGILSTILSARSESKLKDVVLADIRLDPPKFTLEIETKQGKKKILIGEDTAVDYYVYARLEGESQVILTSRSLRFSVDKQLPDLRKKAVLEFQPSEIKTFKMVSSGREDLTGFSKLTFVNNGKGEWMAEEPLKVALDNTEVESFLATLAKTTVKGFYSEDPQEKKKLPFIRPLITFEIEKMAETTPKSLWKLISLEKAKGQKTYYLSEEGKESVFEVNDAFVNNFKINLFKFRPKTITKLKKTDINEIEIQRGDTEITLTKTGEKWMARYKDPKKIYEGPALADHAESLAAKLSDLEALQYLDTWDSRRAGLDAPSAVVVVRRKDATSSTDLANLFFGKKIDATQVVVRKENMEAAAGVSLDVEYYFPKDPSKILEKLPEVESKKEVPSETSVKKESVMLQPTVSDPKKVTKLPAPIVKPGHRYRAVINMTDGKIIEIEFAPDKAPYTVSNFLHLARNRFYDGVKFHRVIPNFVIQGGDPMGVGSGGPGYKFDNEDNDLKHLRGSISMAHAGRNTNGSQFFLVLKPQPHLDGVHTVFGKVTKGEDILDAVKAGDVMKKVEVFEEAL